MLLLGEIHTSASDHSWPLETLQWLARGGRPLLLGLEMVPAARQPILARFASGQLNEAAFLAAVDWPAIWGHDPELYRPLLRWARRQGVTLLALNPASGPGPAPGAEVARDAWRGFARENGAPPSLDGPAAP